MTGAEMNPRYDELVQKAKGLAFILGPVLLLIAALTFTLDIGRNPNDLDGYIEGMIGFYAFLFFIPIWVTLAGVVGQRYPRFGIVLAVLGMMSAASATTPMTARVLQKSMIDAGIDVDIWEIFDREIMLPVVIIMPLFPIIGALLGVGLLRGRLLEPWVGIGLILTAPMFLLVQAGGGLVEIAWPLTAAIYVAVLVPLGWRLFTTGRLQSAPAAFEEVVPA